MKSCVEVSKRTHLEVLIWLLGWDCQHVESQLYPGSTRPGRHASYHPDSCRGTSPSPPTRLPVQGTWYSSCWWNNNNKLHMLAPNKVFTDPMKWFIPASPWCFFSDCLAGFLASSLSLFPGTPLPLSFLLCLAFSKLCVSPRDFGCHSWAGPPQTKPLLQAAGPGGLPLVSHWQLWCIMPQNKPLPSLSLALWPEFSIPLKRPPAHLPSQTPGQHLGTPPFTSLPTSHGLHDDLSVLRPS